MRWAIAARSLARLGNGGHDWSRTRSTSAGAKSGVSTTSRIRRQRRRQVGAQRRQDDDASIGRSGGDERRRRAVPSPRRFAGRCARRRLRRAVRSVMFWIPRRSPGRQRIRHRSSARAGSPARPCAARKRPECRCESVARSMSGKSSAGAGPAGGISRLTDATLSSALDDRLARPLAST